MRLAALHAYNPANSLRAVPPVPHGKEAQHRLGDLPAGLGPLTSDGGSGVVENGDLHHILHGQAGQLRRHRDAGVVGMQGLCGIHPQHVSAPVGDLCLLLLGSLNMQACSCSLPCQLSAALT